MSDIFEVFFHSYRPQPGDIVVEVGAGTGHETKYLSDWVGENGSVLAVEANPIEYAVMLRVCEGRTNIRFFPVAALDFYGETKIFRDGQRSFIHDHDASVTVEATTLDLICVDLPRIDFLKMNIEGSEVAALKGFERGLKRTSNVMVSCHDFIGFETREQVRTLLVRAGFVVTHWEEAQGDWARDYLYGHR